MTSTEEKKKESNIEEKNDKVTTLQEYKLCSPDSGCKICHPQIMVSTSGNLVNFTYMFFCLWIL